MEKPLLGTAVDVRAPLHAFSSFDLHCEWQGHWEEKAADGKRTSGEADEM